MSLQGLDIIHYYNRLNGNSISLEKLKAFRKRVESHIESTGTGPHMTDLKGILARVSKAIKSMIDAGADIAERVELVPIDVNKHDGKILRVASGYEEKVESPKQKAESSTGNVKEISIASIHTDTKRFQNRTDAFSEASANNVALHFDANKFDPIVVWKDPKNGKTYVLSGHSRLEGMKRRNAKTIPVRYFTGNEEEAIKFARVEANRSANAENLIEDLAAYKLMRDGKEGVKPATKTELQRIFKGKVGKLEAYSYLNTGGLFVQSLSQSNTSNYPYLERNAQWVGILRNQYPVISHTGEDNIFHFFYSDKSGRNIKISKDDFFALAKKKVNQLRKDESVLFPECSSDGCKQTIDREADPQKGEAFKRLREINEELESIREKLTSKDATVRVTTEEEKKYLRATAEKLEAEKQRINRDLDLIDKSQASLFGLYGLECGCPDGESESEALGELNNTAYQVITDRILELLNDNGLMWRQPWDVGKANFTTNMAHNYVTKHIYRGGNSYLTWLFLYPFKRHKNGKTEQLQYTTPYFFTFKQVTNLGGKIKKDERGWPVVYFKWLYKDIKANKLVEKEEATNKEGLLKPGYDRFPGIFYYTVFNYDQTEGLKIKFEKKEPKTEAEKIESAESIVNNMPNPPKIERVGADAFYQRTTDLVRVPPMKYFKVEQQFYGVLFHELIHSTGHEKRVYREREVGRKFGDKKYAFEELIAELGSSFLCGEAGIFYFTMNNSAAYIKNWSQVLREEMKADPKFYFKAAGQAQKAADYILDRKEAEVQPEPSKAQADKPTFPGAEYINDIDKETARRAFYWTSFDPEGRGERWRQGHAQTLQDFRDKIKPIADKYGKSEEFEKDFDRFRKKMKELATAYLHSHSNVASAAVTGPANFPTARNNKKSDIADRKYGEYLTYSRRIAEVLRNKYLPDELKPVKSGQSNALEILRKRLAEREKAHEMMLLANKIIQSKKSDTEKFDELVKAGWSEKDSRKLLQPDYAGRKGYASFSLTNNNAEIKRLKDRIAQEEKLNQKRETGNKETKYSNGTVIENYTENRLQIIFPGKPDEATRTKLKKSGFVWAPSQQAWQRQLTENARWTLKRLLPEIGFNEPLNGPQIDAFDIQPKKKHRGPLNPLQMAQLQDAIKAGRTPKVNLKAKINAKEKPAPLFDQPVNDPRQGSLFGKGVSASSLAGMEFKTLAFDGKWKEHIGTPSENFSAMVWGKPKQGKTHYSFQFANYLSKFGPVLYVLSDEGIGYTVKEKIIANGLDKNDKVHFIETRQVSEVESAIKSGNYKFIFIDLISNLRNGDEPLKADGFYNLRKRYPAISFIPVFSSTKNGNFRGDQDWAHDVDVLVDVEAGKAVAQGRFGGGEYQIFPKSKLKKQ